MFRLVFLLLLILLVLGGWLSLGLVVIWSGPEPLLSRVLFYALLSVATLATGAVIAYGLSGRVFLFKRDRGRVGLSLAQGLPLCFAVTFAAWLQGLRLLGLVNAIILIGLFAMLEYALLPKGSKVQ